jgi:hypothetical protein
MTSSFVDDTNFFMSPLTGCCFHKNKHRESFFLRASEEDNKQISSEHCNRAQTVSASLAKSSYHIRDCDRKSQEP